jgi:hypothetical protein
MVNTPMRRWDHGAVTTGTPDGSPMDAPYLEQQEAIGALTGGTKFPLWSGITGTPFVTVSPVGTAQGYPKNNGANYGPDTAGTTTKGVQEAWSSGKSVMMGSGTFDVAPVQLKASNQIIRGAGIGVTILNISGTIANGFTSANGISNVIIADLSLVQTFSPAGPDVAFVLGTSNSNLTFERVSFKAPGSQVVLSTENASLTAITAANVNFNLTFSECVIDGTGQYASAPNCVTSIGRNVSWIGCRFINAVGGGLILYGLARPNIDGPFTVIGCTFYGNYQDLIVQQVYGATISSNSFYSTTGGAGLTIIGFSRNSDYPSEEGPNIGVSVVGNTLVSAGTGLTGGQLIAVSYVTGLSITGNILRFTGSLTSGINSCIAFYAAAHGVTVTANNMDGASGVTPNGVDFVDVDVVDANLVGNVFLGSIYKSVEFGSAVTGPILVAHNMDGSSQGGPVLNSNVISTLFYVDNWGASSGLPLGFTYLTTPAVPNTGTDVTNTTGFRIRIYILTAGTVTAWQITDARGTAQSVTGALTAGQFFDLDVGAKIQFTYSAAPTWKWYGT